MRTLVFALLLLTAAPAARAAQPTADPAPKLPHMSRQKALAYLDKEQLAVEPSNLVNPLLSGDAETVEALLSAGVGAKVNETAPSELSPLMVAAQHCPAPVVRRLLRAGADLKFKTSLGISP